MIFPVSVTVVVTPIMLLLTLHTTGKTQIPFPDGN
jgi:hypothetical protein